MQTWNEVLQDPRWLNLTDEQKDLMESSFIERMQMTPDYWTLSPEAQAKFSQDVHQARLDQDINLFPNHPDPDVNARVKGFLRKGLVGRVATRAATGLNAFNAIEWMSRNVGSDDWGKTIRAIDWVRQNEGLSGEGLAVDIPIEIGKALGEFALIEATGGLAAAKTGFSLASRLEKLGKAGKYIGSMIKPATLFATHSLFQLSNEEEGKMTWDEFSKKRALGALRSGATGAVIGALGKAVPKRSVRAPLVVGGFSLETFIESGGDIPSTVKSGAMALGFETLGAIEAYRGQKKFEKALNDANVKASELKKEYDRIYENYKTSSVDVGLHQGKDQALDALRKNLPEHYKGISDAELENILESRGVSTQDFIIPSTGRAEEIEIRSDVPKNTSSIIGVHEQRVAALETLRQRLPEITKGSIDQEVIDQRLITTEMLAEFIEGRSASTQDIQNDIIAKAREYNPSLKSVDPKDILEAAQVTVGLNDFWSGRGEPGLNFVQLANASRAVKTASNTPEGQSLKNWQKAKSGVEVKTEDNASITKDSIIVEPENVAKQALVESAIVHPEIAPSLTDNEATKIAVKTENLIKENNTGIPVESPTKVLEGKSMESVPVYLSKKDGVYSVKIGDKTQRFIQDGQRFWIVDENGAKIDQVGEGRTIQDINEALKVLIREQVDPSKTFDIKVVKPEEVEPEPFTPGTSPAETQAQAKIEEMNKAQDKKIEDKYDKIGSSGKFTPIGEDWYRIRKPIKGKSSLEIVERPENIDPKDRRIEKATYKTKGKINELELVYARGVDSGRYHLIRVIKDGKFSPKDLDIVVEKLLGINNSSSSAQKFFEKLEPELVDTLNRIYETLGKKATAKLLRGSDLGTRMKNGYLISDLLGILEKNPQGKAFMQRLAKDDLLSKFTKELDSILQPLITLGTTGDIGLDARGEIGAKFMGIGLDTSAGANYASHSLLRKMYGTEGMIWTNPFNQFLMVANSMEGKTFGTKDFKSIPASMRAQFAKDLAEQMMSDTVHEISHFYEINHGQLHKAIMMKIGRDVLGSDSVVASKTALENLILRNFDHLERLSNDYVQSTSDAESAAIGSVFFGAISRFSPESKERRALEGIRDSIQSVIRASRDSYESAEAATRASKLPGGSPDRETSLGVLSQIYPRDSAGELKGAFDIKFSRSKGKDDKETIKLLFKDGVKFDLGMSENEFRDKYGLESSTHQFKDGVDRVWNHISKTSEQKLRSFGKEGSDLADKLIESRDKIARAMRVTNIRIKAVESAIGKTGREELKEYYKKNIGEEDLSDKARAGQRFIDRAYRSLAKVAQNMGALTFDKKTQKWRPFSPITDRFSPRMLKEQPERNLTDINGSHFKLAVERTADRYMKKEGMSQEEAFAEAVKDISFYLSSRKNGSFGPIEKSRLEPNFPEEWYERDPFILLRRYTAGFYKWSAQREMLGYKGVGKVKTRLVGVEPLENSIKAIGAKAGAKAAERARAIALDSLGLNKNEAAIYDAFFGRLRTFNAIRLLGGSPVSVIKQGTQIFIGSSQVGWLNTLKAMKNIIVDSGLRGRVSKSGALGNDLLFDLTQSENAGTMQMIANASLAPFKLGDAAGRYIGAATGELHAGQLLRFASGKSTGLENIVRRLVKGKEAVQLDARNSLRDMYKLTEKEIDQAIESGKFSRSSLLKINKSTADMFYFRSDPLSMPEGFGRSPVAKTLFQFMTFAWKQAKLISDYTGKEALKGNLFPLMRLMAGGIIGGELGQLLYNSMLKRERQETTGLERIINDLAFAGTAGIIMDFAKNSPDKFLLGPSGSLFVELYNKTAGVIKGTNTLREAGKELATRQISSVGYVNKVLRSDKESSYTSFYANLKGASKSVKGGAFNKIFGSRQFETITSKLWNAASNDNYNDFEAEMNRRVAQGVDIRKTIMGLARSMNPSTMLRSMSPAELKALRSIHPNYSKKLSDAQAFWRENVRRLQSYWRIYQKENRAEISLAARL